ncbi:MAG TPA: DUF3857 domain-containing protein [Chitinophagaceae bacterium]|nr:DUF3857 domain-containing protein [Chitinophagaceae bacterium]
MPIYKTCFVVVLVAFTVISAGAQSTPYSTSAVAEALKSNASVIIHLENIEMNVESVDKATLNVHKVFTVLNEEGSSALLFNEYATKFISLDEAEIKVFDAAGKQVHKFRKKDMTTVAVGEGLVEDGYVTYYRIRPDAYPVTVEFSYEQKLKSTLYFPDYRFLHAKEAVVESNYTAKIPAGITLRYKAQHSAITPVITENGPDKIYKWTVKNLAPVLNEEGSAGSNNFPYVHMVTDQFSHYGFRGDLSSWKAFGLWISDLYKGLDELPVSRQQFFQNLVAGAPDNTEKERRIYEYLQQNFRYVSIQLGIGGLRPFSAAFTDAKKYGDCKALSNYMKAALNAVGIRSHVAIINAAYNEEPVDADFPANNFNHVILCVPGPNDTTWLECTSNTAAFATLGTFTENRNALLITETGGVLVATPKSNAAANLFATHTTIQVAPDLAAVAQTKLTTKGVYREIVADVLKENKDDQKESLVLGFGFKQPDFFELAAAQPTDDFQAALKMEIGKLPEFNAGTKYFFKPRINKIWSKKLPSAENRKLDYYFRFPFENKDTTVLVFAAGFKPDVLAAGKELRSPYGVYKTQYWYQQKENAVYTVTTLTLTAHKIPAAEYGAVKTFFDAVVQDDAQRIVMLKTETNAPEGKAF